MVLLPVSFFSHPLFISSSSKYLSLLLSSFTHVSSSSHIFNTAPHLLSFPPSSPQFRPDLSSIQCFCHIFFFCFLPSFPLLNLLLFNTFSSLILLLSLVFSSSLILLPLFIFIFLSLPYHLYLPILICSISDFILIFPFFLLSFSSPPLHPSPAPPSSSPLLPLFYFTQRFSILRLAACTHYKM